MLMKTCKECRAFFALARKEQIYCSKSCASVKKRKDRAGKRLGLRVGWTYATWVDKDGYVLRYAGLHPFSDGRLNIRENVRLMELRVGRHLFSDEMVHHRNGDRKDNRLENLQLMTRSEHSKLHGENWERRERDAAGRFV